jgi:hypothetical protein
MPPCEGRLAGAGTGAVLSPAMLRLERIGQVTALAAAVLILVALFLYGHANAAVLNVGGHHQQQRTMTCPETYNNERCFMMLTAPPSGKYLVVRRAYCDQARADVIYLETLTSSNVLLARSRVGDTRELLHLVASDNRVRISSTSPLEPSTLSCTISGELFNK